MAQDKKTEDSFSLACFLHEPQFIGDPFAVKAGAGQGPGLEGGVGNAR